jgi:PhoH-like ATPase
MDIRVLDTNVLLHSPTALNSFKSGIIVLPLIVIEELDNQKKRQDEVGRNARKTIKIIDKLQEKADSNGYMPLSKKVKLTIFGEFNEHLAKDSGLDINKPDNLIIIQALTLQEMFRDHDIILVSNDGAARVKARKLGLIVESLDEDRINVPVDDIYTGWTEMLVSPDRIEEFFKEGSLRIEDSKLLNNQFVVLKSDYKLMNSLPSALARFDGTKLVPLEHAESTPWDIYARNMQQKFLLEALMNPDIKLVTVIGKAGTGKTLLATAVGGQLTVENKLYKKMIVYKPIIPVGRDIGFLPGEQEDKLKPWMASIYDALEFIMDNRKEEKPLKVGKGKKSTTYYDYEEKSAIDKVEFLIDQGLIELSALTYIRGRSLPKLFIIVDEAQNLTPHELKTIISRAGDDTKIILTGDPYQIDHPFLDSQNNGLVYTIERFKDQELFAHVTLERPERSTLSALAADLL